MVTNIGDTAIQRAIDMDGKLPFDLFKCNTD